MTRFNAGHVPGTGLGQVKRLELLPLTCDGEGPGCFSVF